MMSAPNARSFDQSSRGMTIGTTVLSVPTVVGFALGGLMLLFGFLAAIMHVVRVQCKRQNTTRDLDHGSNDDVTVDMRFTGPTKNDWSGSPLAGPSPTRKSHTEHVV